jgi:hypothetical protein
LVAGGPTPFVVAWLLQNSGGSTLPVTLFCVAVIGVAMVGILMSPETRHLEMSR